MQESLLYIQRIKAMYDTNTFSKSDQQIADYLLKNPNRIASATASELARDTDTSPATVVRFCRKLGFAGLADLKTNAMFRYSDEEALSHGDSAECIKHKVINYTGNVLKQMEQLVDAEALAKAAQLLKGARRIVITGEGGSGAISQAAYDVLAKLALPCQVVMDPMFQSMTIDTLDERDVLFVIGNSGRSLNSLKNLEHARERGVHTIGIVGMGGSPISRFLEVEITTTLFASELFSDNAIARICEMTIVSMVYSIIAVNVEEEQLEKGNSIIRALERKRLPL